MTEANCEHKNRLYRLMWKVGTKGLKEAGFEYSEEEWKEVCATQDRIKIDGTPVNQPSESPKCPDFYMEDLEEWLVELFPQFSKPNQQELLSIVRDHVYEFLLKNLMLRFDKLTMKEILDDNSSSVTKDLYQNFPEIERATDDCHVPFNLLFREE